MLEPVEPAGTDETLGSLGIPSSVERSALLGLSLDVLGAAIGLILSLSTLRDSLRLAGQDRAAKVIDSGIKSTKHAYNVGKAARDMFIDGETKEDVKIRSTTVDGDE